MKDGYSICFNDWALDKEIKSELGLLLIISSLTAERGYCFASNNYFSELFKIDEVSVSRKIKKLEQKKYISIEYEKRGAEVVSRKIRLTKMLTDDIQKSQSTINKNVKDNNTSTNTTSINKERKKDNATFDEIINNFSENEETRFLLKEWLKVRKLKRAPLTNYAINLNLNKLHNLAKESNLSVNKYLEEVIARGWQAFYAINNYSIKEKNTNKQTSNDLQSAFERLGA